MLGLLVAAGASVTGSLLVLQMAVLPLLFKYSKQVKRKIVFSNCLNYPCDLDYEDPASVDVIGGRHINIHFYSAVDNCHIVLGVWHLVPSSMFNDVFFNHNQAHMRETLHQELRRTRNPVLIYCHGNAYNRAAPSRLQMYKVFQELNFHVITFDYRGFGDSSNVQPTERGVVEDLVKVYAWLIKTLDKGHSPMIILWGHSLGTAVAASMVNQIYKECQEKKQSCLPLPHALVLEAPFNNLVEEIKMHPLSKLVSWLPYYKEAFIEPFTSSSEYVFSTDKYLTSVPNIPILMLHSVEDMTVPYELAVKLYEDISNSRTSGGAPVVLHTFERGSGVDHINICAVNVLPSIVSDFLKLLEDKKK